ncbi:MAG: hypothetical protein BWY61_01010 [Firmicutes bacterium ADurb.Bin354]|nr:MAG: hypothetical protein BWY61_01010 [Firmicutes bacterium ADurb.Bin354]
MPHFSVQYAPYLPTTTSPPHLGHFPIASSEPNIFFSSSLTLLYVFIKSVTMSLMPLIKASALISPLETRTSAFSQSAVICGDFTASGRMVMSLIPSSVGTSFFLSLLTKPSFTSFSMISALVAGVPRPLRSTSSSISEAPAVSIYLRSVSSVKAFGGCVKPSTTLGFTSRNDCPSLITGIGFSSSSASVFTLKRFLSIFSYFLKPSDMTVFPLA